jgi:hypothetical protein
MERRGVTESRTGRYQSAQQTVDFMREALTVDDDARLFRFMCQGRDHLAQLLALGDTSSWSDAPTSTGDRSYDLLLAALASREFRRAGQDPPAWCAQLEPLDHEWLPRHPFLPDERVRAETPPFLAELNIFIPERDLITAMSYKRDAARTDSVRGERQSRSETSSAADTSSA